MKFFSCNDIFIEKTSFTVFTQRLWDFFTYHSTYHDWHDFQIPVNDFTRFFIFLQIWIFEFDCCFEFLTQNWNCLSSWNRKKKEQSFSPCSYENWNCLFWKICLFSVNLKRQTLPDLNYLQSDWSFKTKNNKLFAASKVVENQSETVA